MRDDEEWLRDILDVAERIASRVARGRSRFDVDEDAQLALTRLIEIVGEACSHVSSDMIERHPEVPWRPVAGMRNRVIRGDFEIDLDLVWIAAQREVPALAQQVQRILGESTT